MKRILLLFLFTAIMASIASAQELKVRSMEVKPMDISASIYLRHDLNGKPCALVKVLMPVEGVVFEGNVLGEVENKAGEYWVYMSAGTKQLRVKHPQFRAVHIMFGDYGIKSLESKVTYELTIEGAMLGDHAQVDIKTKVLRNQGKEEELHFMNGDCLSLAFQSPISGYLAVYLLDEDRHAYCLLPYNEQKEGSYRIEGNKQYLFFDERHAESLERRYVEEYRLSSNNGTVENQLYVIFSAYQFYKAADYDWDKTTPLEDAVALPRQLDEEEFLEWLSRCQQRDKAMTVITKQLTISQ